MTLKVESPCKECSSDTEVFDPKAVRKILEKHRNGRALIISILEDIQAEYGYLPSEALRLVANEMGCSLVDIYGVATFYHSFSLKPRGKHVFSVCMGTACHVRGGPSVAAEFERRLGIKAGETTSDKEFSLETVNCLGACALGPIVLVDGHYFSHVDIPKVEKIIERVRIGLDKVNVKTDKRVIHLEVVCPACGQSLMDPKHPIDDCPSIYTVAGCNGTRGWVRLSSIYGSYSSESQYDAPPDVDVDFFCPHCRSKLVGTSKCPECGAPMVSMRVNGGGVVQTCTHHGCKGHALYLTGIIPQEIETNP